MSDKEKSDVFIVSCPDYSRDSVDAAVNQVFTLLDGMQILVNPGQKVLLKPNLLRAAHPDDAISTHPAIVRAVASRLKAVAGDVIIADSPAGLYNKMALQQVYGKCRMDKAAGEAGAVLNFNTRARQLANPRGKLIKLFDIIEPACTADVIINLPKLKTHNYMIMTGAVKNLFGLIPGTSKVGYHTRLPDTAHFAEMLVDLYLLVRPSLTIMDAVVGMEGNGPSAGKPRQIGLILASGDGMALDAVAARIMGFAPDSIPTLRAARERGIAGASLEQVNVVGVNLDRVSVDDFEKPSTSSPGIDRLPDFLKRVVTRYLVVQPEINNPECIGCGNCQTVCPSGAISIENGVAVIDKSRCFRCYCCHEVCPQKAVSLQRSRVARILK